MVVIIGKLLKRSKKIKVVGVLIIDMFLKYEDRDILLYFIVDLCEEFGIFKFVNYGIFYNIIFNFEINGFNFFF